MEETHCILCSSARNQKKFKKPSRQGEFFTLVRCKDCGLEYVNPRPDESEIGAYYESSYFSSRTDRGYNNYFSDEVRKEVERVYGLNLQDLKFYEFEKSPGGIKRSLDVGCAAGYFVLMMQDRGWDASGIDVSGPCIEAAEAAGLSVVRGSYLEQSYDEPFDLITLWATIEHLHHPELFLRKILSDLSDNGMLILSTCRIGGFNFQRLMGAAWRFYNFPEHLCFFSNKNMYRLLEQEGFEVTAYHTYGSGIGNAGSYRKRAADFMAGKFGLGDMMILAARRA